MFNEVSQKKITSIQFGLFSPEEIKRGSVVHVIHPETIESGIPKENGLIDLRMGTTEATYLCQTCNGSPFDCNGHFGHIELTKPMLHIGYITQIKKTLDCVCFYCSKIKCSKSSLRRGLGPCWEVLKTKTICQGEPAGNEMTGCGNKQPVIRKEGMNLIAYMKGEDGEGKVVLSGDKIYNIFKRISEEDYTFLGFDPVNCKPEWMLLTVLLVPPPCVRPSIVMSGSLRGEDDLTHKIADIIKANTHLKKYEQEGAPSHIVRDYEQLLQFHLATFIDNDINGQPQSLQKNGRPLKSLSARLKGKEGRVRGNLMGKRVDYSARSVITPDPNISCEEVGVPLQIAMIHTFPERVTRFNVEKLQGLIENGPGIHPGANYVVRNDGQRIDLAFNRQGIVLEPGFIVERHMQNGDPVLFNRQPSLHKMSMMGHRAKIMGDKTFRLNLSVTAPYNADFDGDEMNLHMPQSYGSAAEISCLANVSHQIVSPQSNRPVIGIVQDATVGAMLFSRKDSFFTEKEAMNLLFSVNSFGKKDQSFETHLAPTILQPQRVYTGKQIFSSILPFMNSFNNTSSMTSSISGFSSSDLFERNLEDRELVIKNGVLLSGTIDKRFVGAQQGGGVHIIFNDNGPQAAKEFIDNIQKLINFYLQTISSFSVGIGDCVADRQTVDLCRNGIKEATDEVDRVIERTKKNELEKLPGMTMYETFESVVNLTLNKARDISGTSAQKSLNSQNNMKAMVVAGSKGSYINISQVTTCVGQQNVEGKRISFGFKERTLPHFAKHDFSARSKGFVECSYLSGLRPWEFYFHAMGGREGLIDTAIKTAETGYIQRRLVKAMEDATVSYDGSVRNAHGEIYQISYGDDAFDATHLEMVAFPVDVPAFKQTFFIDNFVELEFRIKKDEVFEDVHQLLLRDAELQKRFYMEYDTLVSGLHLVMEKNKASAFCISPVNIQRIIQNALSSGREKRISLSPYTILDTVDALMTGNEVLDYYIRISLAVRPTLLSMDHRIFSTVVDEIRRKIMRARVNGNEMVGTIAAQSVGEPATQMTLNTFHLAGVSSNVTMGVPRLNEIINVARNIKTPLMRILLEGRHGDSAVEARQVQSRIEFVSLRQICSTCEILYDPNVMETVVDEDREFVRDYFEMPDEDVDFTSQDRFVVRVVIDRGELVSKQLTLEKVANKLREKFRDEVHVLTSDENAERPTLRMRFFRRREDLLDGEFVKGLLGLHIQGVPGIKKAYIGKDTVKGRYYLETEGINFDSFEMQSAGVRCENVVVNDLHVISAVLGIEAARLAILNELSFVMESNGSYVNQRHLALLADVMTMRGYLAGITRHGVSKCSSALKRASFEQTVDILLEAAVSSARDETNGITENIILGQIAPLGTGKVDLLFDITKLGESVVYPVPSAAGSLFSPVSNDSVSWSPRAYGSVESSQSSFGFSPDVSNDYGSSISFSPSYNPMSPSYSPASPSYSPASPSYSPVSPSYSPVSPSYSPVSPSYSPASPSYNPVSPSYSPVSPSYSPVSPSYNPYTNSMENKKENQKKK